MAGCYMNHRGHKISVMNKVREALLFIVVILLVCGNMIFSENYDIPDFLQAADNGDLQAVKNYVENGMPVNETGSGWTALHHAARKGHVPVVQYLLQHKADPQKRTGDGYTPIIYACFAGSAESVSLLLKAGGNAKDEDNKNSDHCLLAAAYSGDIPTVKLLLRSGMKVDQPNTMGETALMQAAYLGHLSLMEFLMNNGANVNAVGQYGESPLNQAISGRQLKALRILLEKGADANISRRGDNFTLLMSTALFNHPEMAQALLKHGANVRAYCPACSKSAGCTARSLAESKGHAEVAKLLKDAEVKMMLNKIAIVKVKDSLNVRDKPTIEGIKTRSLSGGEKVRILQIGEATMINGVAGYWVRIGENQWIFDAFLDYEK